MKIYNSENSQNVFKTPTSEILSEFIGAGLEESTSNYSIAHVKILPGGLTPKHFHPEVEETYCITKGRGLLTVDSEEAEVKPGDVVQIKPPSHHKIVTIGEEAFEMLIVCAPAWTPDCTVWLEQWQDGRVVTLGS